jgi:DNA modification methylase
VRVEDRTQDTIWEFPKPKKSGDHPTMKPVELCERAIQNSSRRGFTVLDLFGGSGSTLIACEKTGRSARLMELAPQYCDVIIKRWQDFTGKTAMHAETGKTFNEMAAAK